LTVFAITLLLGAAPLDGVPIEKQIAVLVRAMAFDRALKSRAEARVDVVILSASGDRRSGEMARAAHAAFDALAGVSVQGLPLATSSIAVGDEAGLVEALKGRNVDVVYACVGLDDLLVPLRREAAARGVLTMGSSAAYVDAGLSLGLDTSGARPTLVVNLVQARSERVDFASEMLKLARVIR
jgi:hypothetical protein